MEALTVTLLAINALLLFSILGYLGHVRGSLVNIDRNTRKHF